ncbi:kynureninase [Sediminibacterium soli]|uniref:kynureninase n=1 Tax=Sediminibacterium soli TaxID=2698829 RepID=UPI00137ABBC8|nr:kynureninase [Sediminibacterium soli]NCI46052.1 kynureninase [Sediminibacterium soli]
MQEIFHTDAGFAEDADQKDALAWCKQQFHFPQHNGKDAIYFCGNSLGLQPIHTKQAIDIELTTWRDMAVGGYFGGANPWLYYQDYMRPVMAGIVGAKENEVTVMNTLTVNLHLMMLSFYRPTKQRYRIIMEAGAFPSDQYAVETMVRHHGFDPADAVVEVHPADGEKLLRTPDIIDVIRQYGDSVALVLFGGISYYTGQLYDIAAITAAAHSVHAVAGFDLAHVAGNVPVQLHDWQVDFAVWCSYKYLNAGPGAAGGVFVHETHAGNTGMQRLGGWWGNDEKTRFKMEKGFVPKPDAGGWNISTAQVFNMVALKASLELFGKTGMQAIRRKSLRLTAYLEYLLQQLPGLSFEIITPADSEARGAQLSLYFREKGREIHDRMIANGIIVDYREPGVIRVAPAPLYCSFTDVYRFYELLKGFA